MKAKVITIKSNKRSVEAAERCIKSGKMFGLNVEMFEAITPDTYKEYVEKYSIPTDVFHDKYSRFENCVSAFLSHYLLWRECFENDENYLILEHDAVIGGQIPDWSFDKCMNIGKPSYGKYNIPSIIGVNQLTSKKYFPGAHAYMLKPKGAKELIDGAIKWAQPTDIYLNLSFFPWLQEYYPWVVDAQDNFTTIQKDAGCKAKHGYNETYGIENV